MQELGPPPGYDPPPPPPSATPPVDRAPLRELATGQRLAIAAGFSNGIGGALIYTKAIPGGLGALVALGVAGFVIVAAFRLANHLYYSTAPAVLSAIAMVVPLVWIIVLVFLCSKASKELRAAGVQVGFFGASPNAI